MNSVIIGYTTGVYDMFHIGHLNLLRNASEYCDELIVGVTSDELSFARKGKWPVVPYAERAAIVSDIRYVDRVVEQQSMDKMMAWQQLHFNFSLVAVRIVYFPYTSHTSSTELRRKIFAT